MSKTERAVTYDVIDGQDIARIELNDDRHAIVDAADWARVYATFGGNWSVNAKAKRPAPGKSVRLLSGKQTRISLARAITQAQAGQKVKAVGDDPLDLRRANLKVTGTPAPRDVLSIPRALATDEDVAEARALLPAEADKPHNKGVETKPTGPVDRTPPAKRRPERIQRLATKLSDARNAARLIPAFRQTATQLSRGYLTDAELNHIWLVIALRRAEGLESGARPGRGSAGNMAQAVREGVMVKPRVTAAGRV